MSRVKDLHHDEIVANSLESLAQKEHQDTQDELNRQYINLAYRIGVCQGKSDQLTADLTRFNGVLSKQNEVSAD